MAVSARSPRPTTTSMRTARTSTTIASTRLTRVVATRKRQRQTLRRGIFAVSVLALVTTLSLSYGVQISRDMLQVKVTDVFVLSNTNNNNNNNEMPDNNARQQITSSISSINDAAVSPPAAALQRIIKVIDALNSTLPVDDASKTIDITANVAPPTSNTAAIGEPLTEQRNTTISNHSHKHAIPNTVLFTHYANLLQETLPSNKKWPRDKKLEIKALSENVKHSVALHPGATSRFLTDDDCIASLQNVMGNDTVLVEYFGKEKEGMYKADLCRGAALWETGGLYFDVDLGVRMNMFDILDQNTTFSTVQVYKGSKLAGSFFQAFMAATPQHPVIYRYIELFEEYYTGKLPKVKRFLGVVLLKMAYDDVVRRENDPTLLVQHTQIWHEYKYNRTSMMHVPEPDWGSRKQCRMVVVTSLDDEDANKTVPFYSRVADTRMCPSIQEMKRLKEEKLANDAAAKERGAERK